MIKPPFISNEYGITYDDILTACRELDINEREEAYLKSVFKLVEIHKRELGIEEIKDSRLKSINGVRKRLNTLCEKGALRKDTRNIPSCKRPVAVYYFKKVELKDMELVAKPIPPPLPSFGTIIERGPMLGDSQLIGVFNAPAIDDLICSVLFGALDFNRLGKRTEIPVVLDWYGESVKVTTRCVTGDGLVIARVTDLKYYIALLTLCDQVITRVLEQGETPKNFFALELLNVNKQLDRKNDGGNIETALKAVHRLSDTVFDIESLPQKIIARFGFDQASQRIQPLTNLGVFDKKAEGSIRKKVAITFSIPEVVFQGILSQRINLFRVNPSLLNEKNEIIFAYHLFCRRLIGSKAGFHYKSTLRRLKDMIAPSPDISYDDFKEKFFSGLVAVHEDKSRENAKLTPIQYLDDDSDVNTRRGSKKGDIIEYNCSVLGYYTKIIGDQVGIHIDALDPYVGIHSLHRALQRKSKALKSLPSSITSLDDVNVTELEEQLGIFCIPDQGDQL